MTTVNHYKPNRRDIEFNLFEYLKVQDRTLGKGAFKNVSEESARDALKALETVCVNDLASSWAETDRHPPERDAQGNVKLPAPLKKSIDAFMDAGWHTIELPEHLGGFGAPPSVRWGAFEMVAGAAPAIAFYVFGPFIAVVIDRLATEAQKKRYLPQMVEKRWAAAMVLTEPDAGSDVGAARAKARQVDGDVWEIEGVKRFITNGDSDHCENVVHLVLARPEGAGPGTKGLSMFIVPKVWVEADGSLGARNGMRCSNLEKKMGLKASATCEMTYGDGEKCRGLLVGNVHDGIRQMFHVIEQARMAVGMKSMATLSTAYLNALAFTKERVQGADLLRAADKAAPRVRIIEHPDVRHMLMAQKAHAEGMRALGLYTASIQDQVELAGGHGAADAKALERLNDLLLPLVKGYCSERAADLLRLSLQCYGGSGYLQDYPAEQYIRDQKIDSLYEGTTHIQALDLLLRKVAKDGGETLQVLLGQIRDTASGNEGGAALSEERALLATGLENLEGALMGLMGKLQDSLYHAGLQGNRVLISLADLVLGWLLIKHAAVAAEKLPKATGPDKSFYEGKVASARWFARNQLPTIALTKEFIEHSRLDLMELSEEAF
ncbi:MAG: acyl-CoA dehydrogenase [Myxococcaceae bacterium]|nr:acyl-CoA dehydrogenase [Myxococcaceae bacterium]